MEQNSKIRAGVIGLGVGSHQARALHFHKDVDLIWLCDFNQDLLQSLRAELNVSKITQQSNDILQNPDIDLVCIASYDNFHYEQVMLALNNGKHVYVEKPICMSKKQLSGIYRTLKKFSHLRLSSNMVLRTCPLFKKLKNIIEKDGMGEIYYLEADYLWGRKEKLISGWRSAMKDYSIIYGAGVHMIDLVIWLTKKKPISVVASGNCISTKKTQKDFNDFVILILEFENNLIIKISLHGGCIHPHFHSLKIFGKNSSFIHDSNGTVWVKSSDPKNKFVKEHSEYPAKIKRNEAITSFVNSLNTSINNNIISETDVFDTMSVCLAAEKSLKTRKKISINY